MRSYVVIILSAVLLSSCSANKHKKVFIKHITHHELDKASAYYEEHKNDMRDEDTVETVKMVSSQLDDLYASEAELLSDVLLHLNNTFKKPENWAFLKEKIDYSHQLIDNYNKMPLLKIQREKQDRVNELNNTLSRLEKNYQKAMSEIFERFNHFSDKNFFSLIPSTVEDKESLLINSSIHQKIKVVNLTDASSFYRVYHNDLQGNYMEVLRKSIIDRHVKGFLATHRTLTIFELELFESYLNALAMNSALLKIQTTPSINIINNEKEAILGIDEENTTFKLSNRPIKSIFSHPEENDSPYSIVMVPKSSNIKVLDEKISYSPSKYPEGFKMVVNPKYNENQLAKQEAQRQVSIAEQALDKVKQQIYKITQASALEMNALVTGQASNVNVVTIPVELLDKKNKLIKSLKEKKSQLELADITLLKTDKKMSVVDYKDYKVKVKEVELQKTVGVGIYVKSSFQKRYYKYDTFFIEKNKFQLFSEINIKDEDMLQTQKDARISFEQYQKQNIAIKKDLLDIKDKYKKDKTYLLVDGHFTLLK